MIFITRLEIFVDFFNVLNTLCSLVANGAFGAGKVDGIMNYCRYRGLILVAVFRGRIVNI